MVKSLVQLRKERDSLLNRSNTLKLKQNKISQDNLERQRLNREIIILKNPKTAKTFQALNKFKQKTGKFLKERGDIISANIARMEEEEKRKAKRKK